jgi:hypothetical protein
VVIGLDLASAEHQVVVLTADGQRLTRFKIPHSRVGLEELLRRTMPAALSRTGGSRVFAFEATGHVWEAVAYILDGSVRSGRGSKSWSLISSMGSSPNSSGSGRISSSPGPWRSCAPA